MSPRPILKRSSADHYSNIHPPELPIHHAVHFPPSNSLTHTFSTHSPLYYDRSPIVVSPNSCTLPERGCPGRTYDLDNSTSYFAPKVTSTIPRGHAHPRAFSRQQNEAMYGSGAMLPVPQLVPDLSSSSESSEESDGINSPIPPMFSGSQRQSYQPAVDRYHPSHITAYDSFSQSIQQSASHAGFFSPRNPSYPQHCIPPSDLTPSPRSRGSPSRHRDSRRRSPPDDDHDPGYDDDADIATPTAMSHTKKRERRKTSGSRQYTGFNCDDEGGCLGGF